jgi:hypothetical protein
MTTASGHIIGKLATHRKFCTLGRFGVCLIFDSLIVSCEKVSIATIAIDHGYCRPALATIARLVINPRHVIISEVRIVSEIFAGQPTAINRGVNNSPLTIANVTDDPLSWQTNHCLPTFSVIDDNSWRDNGLECPRIMPIVVRLKSLIYLTHDSLLCLPTKVSVITKQ